MTDVFVIVHPLMIRGKRHYQVNFVCKPGVIPFRPLLAFPPVYERSPAFRELFLTKCMWQ